MPGCNLYLIRNAVFDKIAGNGYAFVLRNIYPVISEFFGEEGQLPDLYRNTVAYRSVVKFYDFGFNDFMRTGFSIVMNFLLGNELTDI